MRIRIMGMMMDWVIGFGDYTYAFRRIILFKVNLLDESSGIGYF